MADNTYYVPEIRAACLAKIADFQPVLNKLVEELRKKKAFDDQFIADYKERNTRKKYYFFGPEVVPTTQEARNHLPDTKVITIGYDRYVVDRHTELKARISSVTSRIASAKNLLKQLDYIVGGTVRLSDEQFHSLRNYLRQPNGN